LVDLVVSLDALFGEGVEGESRLFGGLAAALPLLGDRDEELARATLLKDDACRTMLFELK